MARSAQRASQQPPDVDVEFPIGVLACGDRRVAAAASRRWSTRSRTRAEPASARTAAGRHVRHGRRRRPARQAGRHRSIADRPHAAQQSGYLHRHVRSTFASCSHGSRSADARLHARAVLVQRQGRPLRGLPRRRHHQDRDALSARRVRAVRGLQGQALQRADARSEVQGQDDFRSSRDARGRGQRVFRERFRASTTSCETICDVGLGYIKMGQPATTLSGGEAQRVKLATELSRRSTGRTFYVLDEPTTGLHFADIHKLLEVLQRLVDAGNTVLVIEHNLDVIKTADYLIDLGPEGGDRGGTVVATGTPEEVARTKPPTPARILSRSARPARVGPPPTRCGRAGASRTRKSLRASRISPKAGGSPSKPSTTRSAARAAARAGALRAADRGGELPLLRPGRPADHRCGVSTRCCAICSSSSGSIPNCRRRFADAAHRSGGIRTLRTLRARAPDVESGQCRHRRRVARVRRARAKAAGAT